MIAFDTETTGLDLHHSARPFLVTICNEALDNTYWEWPVDPLTRMPVIPSSDVVEIKNILAVAKGWGDDFDEEIGERHTLILQNGKFDALACRSIGITEWPWKQMRDTLVAGHILASNRPHGLDEMAVQYLGRDISRYERDMKDAVLECRRKVQAVQRRVQLQLAKAHGKKKLLELSPEDLARQKLLLGMAENELANWKLAKKDGEGMPSASDKTWKHDLWLPRAYADYLWRTSPAGIFWEQEQTKLKRMTRPVGRKSPSTDFSQEKIRSQVQKLKGWEYHPPDVEEEGLHRYRTVVAKYANIDSATTMLLWKYQYQELHNRNLWKIFKHRMQLPEIFHSMEAHGVTGIKDNMRSLKERLEQDRKEMGQRCVNVAASLGYKLEMPGAGNSDSLLDFMFGPAKVVDGVKDKAFRQHTPHTLNLNPLDRSEKTGQPALTKDILEQYALSLKPNTKGLIFCKALRKKRKRDTALSYIKGYERFWLPARDQDDWHTSHFVLYPSLNMTGTATLRCSSSNPNEQNISKQMEPCQTCNLTGQVNGKTCLVCVGEGEVSLNLREAFGPLPDEEWWSLDAKNIELRLPAYRSRELELIGLFEKPKDPPYYGSNHILNFHTVYPDIWEKALREGRWEWKDEHYGKKIDIFLVGPYLKKKYASTYYQWCKNGGFALQYGAGEAKVDATFRRKGAYQLLVRKFDKLLGPGGLNDQCIRHAEAYGYIETIPDITVDPDRGYPLLCTRTEYGSILSTVPLNYMTQGSAMWWTCKAMIRTEERLKEWRKNGFKCRIAMQVHDEIVFAFQKSKVHPSKDIPTDRRLSNLWRVRELQSLMSKGGDDFGGIPTPVGAEYHSENWGQGISF